MMNILIIGPSGAGKSRFARKLQAITGAALLPLDRLWHVTDYSEEAMKWFIREQQEFIQAHDSWIIDGNYASTLSVRIEQADLVLWLKVARLTALLRVIARTVRRRINKNSRPDMPDEFSEKFDREYLKFLSYVWHLSGDEAVERAIADHGMGSKVLVLHNKREQQTFLENFETRD